MHVRVIAYLKNCLRKAFLDKHYTYFCRSGISSFLPFNLRLFYVLLRFIVFYEEFFYFYFLSSSDMLKHYEQKQKKTTS